MLVDTLRELLKVGEVRLPFAKSHNYSFATVFVLFMFNSSSLKNASHQFPRIDIMLNFLSSILVHFLKIGFTLASFQSLIMNALGKIPF